MRSMWWRGATVWTLLVLMMAASGCTRGAGKQGLPSLSSIPSDCSSDVTASLNSFFAHVRPHETIRLPPRACYLTQGTVVIKGRTGLDLEGDGALLKRTDPGRGTSWLPHLLLQHDRGLVVSALAIAGTREPGAGSPGLEGHYGIVLRQDKDVTLTHVSVRHVSGDFINLFPAPPGAPDQSLNREVEVVRSSFDSSGYHGVTIEAVRGATFRHDTFSQIPVDSVDLEYDIYPTVFKDGQPTVAAEDGITFDHDLWLHDGGVWFVSLQGQRVQEDGIRLTDNVLRQTELSVQVAGNAQVPNKGLTISGNRGDLPVGGPFPAVLLKNVEDVRISHNVMPLFDGTPTYFPDHPHKVAVVLEGVSGARIEQNSFPGAAAVVDASPPGYRGRASERVSACGNRYWVRSTRSEGGACMTPTS